MFEPKLIQNELIGYHYDNFLASHFDIKKTCELLTQKILLANLLPQCRGLCKRL